MKNMSSDRAVKLILEKNNSIVDMTMDGGFTALHIAAANDFVEITSLLLDSVSQNKSHSYNFRSYVQVAI